MNSPYDRMPLDRLRADALHGVSAAREAYRRRDPVHADLDLGPVVLPGEQARQRVLAAVGDYQRQRQRPARSGT